MPADGPSLEARLDIVELLMRELLALQPPKRRAGIVDRVRAMVTAREAVAALSGKLARRARAAELRVALERMTE